MRSGGASGHSEIVQTAGRKHDLVNKAAAPVAEGVGHDVAAFDPGDGVFDGDPHFADKLVDRLLDRWSSRPFGFFLGWRVSVPSGS